MEQGDHGNSRSSERRSPASKGQTGNAGAAPQPIVHIFSEDAIWAWLCAQHISARGASAFTSRIRLNSPLEFDEADRVWLVVDLDTYRPEMRQELEAVVRYLWPLRGRIAFVISESWPRSALRMLPVGPPVIRNPDMRILVRSLLTALKALGCSIQPAAEARAIGSDR